MDVRGLVEPPIYRNEGVEPGYVWYSPPGTFLSACRDEHGGVLYTSAYGIYVHVDDPRTDEELLALFTPQASVHGGNKVTHHA